MKGNGMDSNVYKKVGRKYEPFGVMYNENYIPDGIWYVKHKPGSTRQTNVGYLEGMFKVADVPVYKDLLELCALEDVCENIMDDKDFRDGIDKIYANKKGYSISDLVHMTISILKKKANEKV